MRTTFKVSFYLRSNYENKEGKSPVMLRVFLNGEMANFGSTKNLRGQDSMEQCHKSAQRSDG